MVQLKQRNRSPWKRAKNYWKLDSAVFGVNGQLIEFGVSSIKYPQDANEARLAKLHERGQRGLIVYDGCDINELRRFCIDRRLVVSRKHARSSKNALIARLGRADDEGGFGFFYLLNLPAEIRVHIYELYLGGPDIRRPAAPQNPGPPPITQASRLLRSESLPIFCRVGKFYFSKWAHVDSENFRSMPLAVLQQIQTLHVDGSLYAQARGEIAYICRFVLRKGEPDLSLVQFCGTSSNAIDEHVREVMRERIQGLDIHDGDCKLRLRSKDHGALYALLDNVHIDSNDDV